MIGSRRWLGAGGIANRELLSNRRILPEAKFK